MSFRKIHIKSFKRKNKIEKGLDDQKKEISEVIQKYSIFIEKLMKDKKDLSQKCEQFSKKIQEKEEEFSKMKILADQQMKILQQEGKKLSQNEEIDKKINGLTQIVF